MDVIILAGGRGNRMEDELPKPLVKTREKPIISHQLDYLLSHKIIGNIIISLGHHADEIINYIKSKYSNINIEFSIETEPLGTAGGLKNALQKSKSDKVLVLNCDDITNINIKDIGDVKENTICVAHPILPFGRIIEKDGYAQFEEKPVLEDWVSCGWYLFYRNDIINYLPDKGSLEYDVFPKIKLRIYKHEGFWKPLNTKKDVIEFDSIKLPKELKEK